MFAWVLIQAAFPFGLGTIHCPRSACRNFHMTCVWTWFGSSCLKKMSFICSWLESTSCYQVPPSYRAPVRLWVIFLMLLPFWFVGLSVLLPVVYACYSGCSTIDVAFAGTTSVPTWQRSVTGTFHFWNLISEIQTYNCLQGLKSPHFCFFPLGAWVCSKTIYQLTVSVENHLAYMQLCPLTSQTKNEFFTFWQSYAKCLFLILKEHTSHK